MRWPKRIRIGYRTLRVRFVNPSSAALDGRNGSQCLGSQKTQPGEMWVATGQDLEEEANTVLHEVIHAVLKNAAHDGFEGEERIVGAITAGLCQSMQDDPQLWRAMRQVIRLSKKAGREIEVR